MLGASVYLSQDLNEIKEYLTRLSKLGVKEIFTSIHIGEEDAKGTLDKLREVSSHINSLEMLLMIDISSATLSRYDMTFEELMEYLTYIKVAKLRVDYGFSDEEIVEISKIFDIVLNASTINDKQCEKLEELGLNLNDIIACHNFYPRPETGLSEKLFLEQNKYLKSKGFKIQAFLAGDEKLRGPIYAGLPTLEVHRYQDPLYVYVELINKFDVDEVLIGDISISDDSLERIKSYTDENIITLRVNDVELNDERLENIFWDVHENRRDVSDDVVRSARTRIIIDFEIEPFNTTDRPFGTVTIDNKEYGRYNGEVQITKKDLDKIEKVNVLAHILDEDKLLLEYILGGDKFKFKENKK